jgi:signal transduction histidine kinase/ActR/RegA family two-component response regulator
VEARWSNSSLSSEMMSRGEEGQPTDRQDDPQAVQAVLRTLIESVACGVLLFGTNGELSSANERMAEMLRIEKGGLERFANFETLVSHLAPRFADSEAVAARWRNRFEGEEASWDELELLRPERRILERFARPVVDGSGRRLGWLEVYRDVTTQRLIEKKLLHLERMAAIGQMVSGVAHELNNPLTSVLGFAQLLLTRRSGSQRDSDIQSIVQAAQRASRIAKNLLLISREAEPERLPVDLNEIVERTLALRSYELRLENIEVTTNFSRHLPPLLADAGQLQQVLLNLIINAEQAIQQKQDKGHILLRTSLISADLMAFQVTDDGPGIAPEPLSHIFDPFFTTKPPGVGTGLGLSIVYGIVHEHGGEVFVDSREGAGATFTVELPVAKSLGSMLPEKSPSAGARDFSMEAGFARGKILVVEDEPTVARLIADVLRDEGHPVDTVLDSREGLHLVRSKTYDLIICDLRMPHIDGRGFYRELVRQGSLPEQRLVFVTGDTLSPNTVKFLKSSGVPYLAKPFRVEELKEVVQQALVGGGRRETAAPPDGSAGSPRCS